MNVSLTPELEEMVIRKVKSGRYGSASEVVREALRLLMERDQLHEVRLQKLQQDVDVGVAQADRGELLPADSVFRDIRSKRRARR